MTEIEQSGHLGTAIVDASGGSAPAAPAGPSRLSRWLLFMALFTAYVPMQIVFALPVVLVTMSTGRLSTLEDLQDPTLLAWMTLLSAAPAALLTLGVGLAWPRLWSWLASVRFALSEWVAWRKPRILPLWSAPLLTLVMLVVVGFGVTLLIGPAEIEMQVQLFSTPGLQVFSALLVSTVVPAAEELIFRGALYNALLGKPREGLPAWRRHVAPFLAASISFALLHLLAGFGTAASLVMILLLSFYLTALRTVTGSVLPSITAHLVWNLAAALALTLANITGIGV